MASSSISFSSAPSLVSTNPINHSSTRTLLSSRFLGTRKLKLRIRPARLGPSNGSRTTCWFKFGKNGVDAERAGIYGSQSRDDFDKDDIEQYFNYMGMLAVEGTYSKIVGDGLSTGPTRAKPKIRLGPSTKIMTSLEDKVYFPIKEIVRLIGKKRGETYEKYGKYKKGDLPLKTTCTVQSSSS